MRSLSRRGFLGAAGLAVGGGLVVNSSPVRRVYSFLWRNPLSWEPLYSPADALAARMLASGSVAGRITCSAMMYGADRRDGHRGEYAVLVSPSRFNELHADPVARGQLAGLASRGVHLYPTDELVRAVGAQSTNRLETEPRLVTSVAVWPPRSTFTPRRDRRS